MPKISPAHRSFRYELKFPPSVNNYWRSTYNPKLKRTIVYIGPEGKKFREHVITNIGKVANTDKRLAVLVELLMPDNRRRDIDNYQKSTLDALKHARVYNDDCLIDDLHVKRAGVDPMKIGKCTVTITEL